MVVVVLVELVVNVVLVVLVTLVVNVVLVVLVRLVVNVLTVAVVLLVRVEVIVLRVVVVFGRDVVTVSVCVEVVLVRVTVVSVVVELTVVVVADIVIVVVVAVTVAVTVVDVVDVPGSSRASASHPCSCKGSTMPRASATQTTGAFIHASCPTDATSQLKDIKATSCPPTQPWAEYGPNFKSRNCNNGISASWCESFNGFSNSFNGFSNTLLEMKAELHQQAVANRIWQHHTSPDAPAKSLVAASLNLARRTCNTQRL